MSPGCTKLDMHKTHHHYPCPNDCEKQQGPASGSPAHITFCASHYMCVKGQDPPGSSYIKTCMSCMTRDVVPRPWRCQLSIFPTNCISASCQAPGASISFPSLLSSSPCLSDASRNERLGTHSSSGATSRRGSSADETEKESLPDSSSSEMALFAIATSLQTRNTCSGRNPAAAQTGWSKPHLLFAVNRAVGLRRRTGQRDDS